jgi:hypothetical protein
MGVGRKRSGIHARAVESSLARLPLLDLLPAVRAPQDFLRLALDLRGEPGCDNPGGQRKQADAHHSDQCAQDFPCSSLVCSFWNLLSMWLVAICVDQCVAGIPQIPTITAVIPNRRTAAVIELAIFRVILVRVNPADYTRYHDVVEECEYVVGLIPQRPVVELNHECVIVPYLYILIGFLTASALVVNRDDDYISGGVYSSRSWSLCRGCGDCGCRVSRRASGRGQRAGGCYCASGCT